MGKKLRIMYLGSKTGTTLPTELQGLAAVIVPGPTRTLICNGETLNNELLTYAGSDFFSDSRERKYRQYPHVYLDMEEVSLDDLLGILQEMGFELELPKEKPEWL